MKSTQCYIYKAKQGSPHNLDNRVHQNLHTALALGSCSINQISLKIEPRAPLTRRGHLWAFGL